MICVGVDVARDKHDCCIISSDGEFLSDVFTIETLNPASTCFCRESNL